MRAKGFSLLEMIVTLLIMSLFLFIFIQIEYLIKRQNALLSTVSGEPSRSFQVMSGILNDLHQAQKVAPHGVNGIQIFQYDRRITWMSVNGTVVRRVNGKKMLHAPSNRITFSLNSDNTVTVSINDPPMSLTVLVGGV